MFTHLKKLLSYLTSNSNSKSKLKPKMSPSGFPTLQPAFIFTVNVGEMHQLGKFLIYPTTDAVLTLSRHNFIGFQSQPLGSLKLFWEHVRSHMELTYPSKHQPAQLNLLKAFPPLLMLRLFSVPIACILTLMENMRV